jgi:hypothetical protein
MVKILSILLLMFCVADAQQVPFRRQPRLTVAAGGGASVTIDTSSSSGAITTGSDYTLAVTVAGNANRVLYVCTGSGVAAGADDINAVSSSVDGAFTEVGKVSDSNWCNSQIWRLVNPTAGAHTITVDVLNNAVQSVGFALSLYNVDTSDPDDAPATANGTGAAPTAAVTLTATEMAIGILFTDSATGVSVTTGTQRQEVENIGADTAGSLASNTGSGSVSITWATVSELYAVVVVTVNSAP